MATKKDLALQKAFELFGKSTQVIAPSTARVIKSHRKAVIDAMKGKGRISLGELSRIVNLNIYYRRFAIGSLVMTGHVVDCGNGRFELAKDKHKEQSKLRLSADSSLPKIDAISEELGILTEAIEDLQDEFYINVLPEKVKEDSVGFPNDDLLLLFLECAEKMGGMHGDYMNTASELIVVEYPSTLLIRLDSIGAVSSLSRKGTKAKIEELLSDAMGQKVGIKFGLSRWVNPSRDAVWQFICETFKVPSIGWIPETKIFHRWEMWRKRFNHRELDKETFNSLFRPQISALMVQLHPVIDKGTYSGFVCVGIEFRDGGHK